MCFSLELEEAVEDCALALDDDLAEELADELVDFFAFLLETTFEELEESSLLLESWFVPSANAPQTTNPAAANAAKEIMIFFTCFSNLLCVHL